MSRPGYAQLNATVYSETDVVEDAFEDTPSYQVLKPRHDPADGVLRPFAEFEKIYSTANGFAPGTALQKWEEAKERQPPLMETQFRLQGRQALEDVLRRRHPESYVEANSTMMSNQCGSCASWILPCIGPMIYNWLYAQFEVSTGEIKPIEDGEGNYLLAGPGVHKHFAPFWTLGEAFNYSSGALTHGDWCIAVVDQGFIGLAMDKGQPVLLPPGLHLWKSVTLKFVRTIDLNMPVIYLGPYTLLTVDEGYCAVTQDNGHQVIKEGGHVHLLTHRNHKFEKFLSTKVQTDTLERLEVITGDNVLMQADATVNWRISNVEMAARNAAETMKRKDSMTGDITKLRNDVLQQASASLSSFIGTVNYSDTFAPSAQVQSGRAVKAKEESAASGLLFDTSRMETAVSHANAVTHQYGVEIMSINVISAQPADRELMKSLALGAVAAAEAQQLETSAEGKRKAKIIDVTARTKAELVAAKSEAQCLAINAEAEATAEVERARGALNAANKVSDSKVAVDLARIEMTGKAISATGSAVFFGNEPVFSELLAPKVMQ